VISRKDAATFSEAHFPNGPESLASDLGVLVEKSDLKGCDGWCVRLGAVAIIRVNSRSSANRQRFTLAHELSHLILGTKPDVATQPFYSNSTEERNADSLAAELLVPESSARTFIGNNLPVDALGLKRLAKEAKVSPIMAACRIVSMAKVLGLRNAAVVFFDEQNKYQWQFSTTLDFSSTDAQELFEQANSAIPMMVRSPNSDGEYVVGSVFRGDHYAALFLQLLPAKIAAQKTYEERIRELKKELFLNDFSFQQSVAACIGIIRRRSEIPTVDQAVDAFCEKYITPRKKWTPLQQTTLLSETGREYLSLEMAKSFSVT